MAAVHAGRRAPGDTSWPRLDRGRDGVHSQIDASDKTLIPGLIDAHVHLMYDSGPDLLTRAPQLVNEWLAIVRQYGDPLSDIEALGHVDLVMKEGRIVYRRDPHARQIQ